MDKGIRTLNIASLNPDSAKEEQAHRDIVTNLIRNRIHIAGIRETHVKQDRFCLLGNYRIINTSARKSETAGVVQGGAAILIHEIAHHRIAQIAR